MKISSLLIAACTLIASFVGTSAVYAFDDDRKTYPGSMCVRFSGATTTNVWLNFSAIGNPSTTQTLRVDCPMINDEDGDGTKSGWIRAVDQNFGAGANNDVTCQMVSIFRSGVNWSGWFSPTRSTPADGNQTQQVNYGEDLGANSVSHYYFSCRIPPRQGGRTSFITSYGIDED